MPEQVGLPVVPVKDGDALTRRVGRPRIPVTEEVLERRSFSRQRVNVSRSKNTDGDAPPRKRGRPPNPVTDQVLEQRRSSRQRVNASRPKREVPSRKPGRPVRAMAEFIVDTRGLSTPTTSCGQGKDSTGTSGAVPSSQQSPPPNPSQENPTGVAARSVPSTDTNMDINLALGVAVLTRKRGRPPIAVNEEVLEQRRLSRQRVNASRSKKQGASTKRGRPRRVGTILEPQGTTSESADQVRRAPDTPRQPNPLKENQSTGPSNVLANKDQNTNSAQDMEHKNVVEYDHMGTISDTGTEIGDREHTIVVEDENMGAISNTGGTEIGGMQDTKNIVQESRRMRSSINKRKKEFMESNTILDLGKQEETCGFCRAQVWAAEFTGRHVGTGPKGYSICCGKGKVQLPLLRVPPSELDELISTRGTRSARFFNKSRIYNNIFAFCSFGGNVDHSVNTGKGPYVFRVSGRTYHSLGSLVPPDGLSPKFAQLYMYDSQEALTHRVNFPGKLGEVDPAIVTMLQEMLERDNVLVAMFRQLRERFAGIHPEPVGLRLLERRTSDGRLENLPTANDYEFAGLVVDNDFTNCRDVVAEHKKRGLQHISELHPCYMSLQYPLLFPFGEDGYRTNIKHRNADSSGTRRNNTVSIREYYSFRAHYRISEGHALLLGGRLFLQFIVDAWCSVERGRLLWVQTHQSIIRSDLYNNIVDSLRRGDVDATDVGKRVILPSSFTGGYRYMQQNFQDSLAVCKQYGHPDLFITFTCNPKWDEIQDAVQSSGSHDASVRPDLVARVFKMKLDAMMNDLTKKHVLGRVLAVVYTVEFQKRGLPHAHIVLWLGPADKLLTVDDIDNVISAEIPDKVADPVGYKAVSQFMMHGPCGAANPKCPCMSNGQCTKHYPKPFSDATVMSDDGYALYRRRDTKLTIECNGVHLDNRHVVPFHRGLLIKYQAHINVEWCNRSLSIKYLFKYIGKGPDTATIQLKKSNQHQPNSDEVSTSIGNSNFDEVKNYLSCRYVPAAESCWRLFEFPIHHREPFVQRLYFHLQNEQEVRFRDNETLPEVVRRVDPDGTMFIQWMVNNKYEESGRDLTFINYPTKFRWDTSAKRWIRRKQNDAVIGRLVYAHPASGERFYMRLLLNFVTGVQDFEDIRTVDGIVYNTYKEACFHRGLLESDREWHIALADASLCANAPQLRDLFVTLLIFCEISNPSELWEKHWPNLSDDIEYSKRKMARLPNLKISDKDKQMLALEAISELLKQYGKKLQDYPSLPELDVTSTSRYKNDLLLEEMMYDREKLRAKASEGVECLNQMQRSIFDEIVESVHTNTGGFYFVYGPGGTGKTFLWSTIIANLRSEGKIVLAVASSGIASLLIEGGRTAQSRFKIPIDANEFTCCEIKQNTYLTELICNTSLVIWDEAPMTHRFVFEAVDRTFRDIRSKVNEEARTLPFGGLTMLLGGDFRQILPVLPKKGRAEIVAATISKSPLWQFCKVFKLQENMRIEKNVPPVTIQGNKVQFREWVLAVGDGLQESIAIGDDPEPLWITLPEEVFIHYSGDPLQAIVKEIYSEIQPMHGDLEYLRNRAILTPLNEHVENVNITVLQMLPGDFKEYKSCDSVCKGSSHSEADEVLYPPEFLNSLKFSGMPNHEIKVKVGAPIMLLRNLNAKKGLCNGTRLIITRCYPFLIEAIIITGKRVGEITYIPRITMCPADKNLPFVLKRKQFPISVCYAMTVNKSQGQTVQNVGLYLPDSVFGHGQMYVAISRVTSPNGLKIVTVDKDMATTGFTKNIVYHEIFDNLM